MTKSDKKVFRVSFLCSNCGNVWSEDYCRGDEILSQSIGYYLRDHRDSAFDSNYGGRIKCSVCDTMDINVTKRKPIR
jgi:hypothetical protein